MPGFTDTDINGRTIDQLFVSSPVALTNQKLFTCNQSPEIAPSGRTCIAYVSVLLSAGADTGTSQLGFGTTPGGTDWSQGANSTSAYTDSPKMFFPTYLNAFRPTSYSNGQGFYLTIGTGFNAGGTGIFTIYGWTY